MGISCECGAKRREGDWGAKGRGGESGNGSNDFTTMDSDK